MQNCDGGGGGGNGGGGGGNGGGGGMGGGMGGRPSISPNPAMGEQSLVLLPAPYARITVHVPADAKVYADGRPSTQTGPVRTFETPALAAGRDYNYTLTVETVVDGEVRQASRRVTVRAGWNTPADFTALTAGQATSAVTVTLPAGRTLLVNGRPSPAAPGVNNFNTPAAPAGHSVAYTFQTETVRDGRTEVETRHVAFAAGKPVAVDFTRPAPDAEVTLK